MRPRIEADIDQLDGSQTEVLETGRRRGPGRLTNFLLTNPFRFTWLLTMTWALIWRLEIGQLYNSPRLCTGISEQAW
jgi:hypothetical protein